MLGYRVSMYFVIKSFSDKGTRDIYARETTKAARGTCPEQLWKTARRKLEYLDVAIEVEELNSPPGNKLKQLQGGRARQYSIRINDQYRICFAWSGSGPEKVEIVDYH
ncbi:MAG: type II toxin-antitoxin system RelE/ParE family toxin [Microcoleaceae cyanobacterium]